MYKTTVPGKNSDECKQSYKHLLSNLNEFEKQIIKVQESWYHSCFHFLTNPSMNRIAWIGQSAGCMYDGTPAHFKSGFQLLTKDEMDAANLLAKTYLEKWIDEHRTEAERLYKQMEGTRLS